MITAGNLSIETNLNTAAHLIVFQILDGPNFGRILLEEKPTQLFTVEGWELIIMLVYFEVFLNSQVLLYK